MPKGDGNKLTDEELEARVGLRNNKLVLTAFIGKGPRYTYRYMCRCDCGLEYSIEWAKFKNRGGACRSCSGKDRWTKEGAHKQAGTRLYGIWKNIIDRCYNQKHTHYKSYGGRGITMYEEWKNDFMVFHKWCHENGYEETLTTDRIDNNLNYTPDNVRFVDQITQANNKRDNRYITIDGETKTLADWCRHYDVPYRRTLCRILAGVDELDALTLPKHDSFCTIKKTKNVEDVIRRAY